MRSGPTLRKRVSAMRPYRQRPRSAVTPTAEVLAPPAARPEPVEPYVSPRLPFERTAERLRFDGVPRPRSGGLGDWPRTTRILPWMLAAMMAAAVGDDVFGEDPTINELERRAAALFGKEAGLFVPSGSMSNQIAVRVHCRPQDEILLETTSHICLWEGGGPAALSGVTCRTIDGRFGILEVADFEGKVRAKDIQEVLKLQADYIKQQMQVYGAQAKELGESTTRAAKDAAAPKR